MKTPPIPADENKRLAALKALKVLDTPRDERFDRLVRLAATIVDVPMAAISLVDTDRQWFKASVGMSVRETPRDISFCGHTINGVDLLEVPDAAADARFADSPLVTSGPRIRFYAGQPIDVGNHAVGAFCVLDTKPRTLTEAQRSAMRDLTRLVERELQIDDLATMKSRLNRLFGEKQIAQSERERFFELSVDMMIIAGLDGRIERMSRSCAKTLGWSREEFDARHFLEFVHPDDRSSTLEHTRRLFEAGRTVSFENRCLHADGRYLVLQWSVIASPDGQNVYATARDVTDIRKMQRMKSEFVSIVSHELRTPLTSIRGSLDLLFNGVAGPLPEEAIELVEVAQSNASRLGLLINDILDLEKIEAGKLEYRLSTECIVGIVKRSIDDNAPVASRKQCHLLLLEPKEDACCRVDPDRVNQVVTNLLSNAIKFSPAGAAVEVRVDTLDDTVRVSVTDRGPGIPRGFQPRIFQKFAQADSSDRRAKGGTGLGLSISKAIVEHLGGEIGFRTEEGKGTTFFFELPRIENKSEPIEDEVTDVFLSVESR